MSEPKQKYRVVYAPRSPITSRKMITPTPTEDHLTWGAQLSALYDSGYEIYAVRDTFIVMRLREDSKYENIDLFDDFNPKEVNAQLAKGWVVTNDWKDKVRMVKRG